MKYVYNQERDRLACRVWDPHFILVVFSDTESGKERGMMLHCRTGLERHMRTVAEKYASETEIIQSLKEIPRREYEEWLCGGEEVEICGKQIPAKFITEFLISEDTPSAEKKNGRYGDLYKKRTLLMEKDANLIQAIASSWELASPEHDIIREAPEPKPDKMDAFFEAQLEK